MKTLFAILVFCILGNTQSNLNLKLKVLDKQNNITIAGAKVTITDKETSELIHEEESDSLGIIKMSFSSQNRKCNIKVTASGYEEQNIFLQTGKGKNNKLNFTIRLVPETN